MTITEVASRFEGSKRTSKGFKALCPVHDDRSPSLSILNGEYRITLVCHAGCSEDAILNAVGLEKKDLFPDSDPPARPKATSDQRTIRLNGNRSAPAKFLSGAAKKRIVTIYPYHDAEGNLLYEKVRYQPKGFQLRRPDGNGGYVFNLEEVKRVPYRLRELLDARRNRIDEIWFAEGEKDTDKLRSLGLTATSFKGWTEALNPHIEGVHAVLVRDHDLSGGKQVNDAARTIAKVAKSVRIIDLFNGEPEQGQDISDWIDARRREEIPDEDIAESLSVIAEGSTGWLGTMVEGEISAGLEIEFLSTVKTQDISWLAWPLIPFGFFTLLDGIEGIGKTFAMLDLAKRLTLGLSMPFDGEKHNPANVLFLSVEDSPEYILKPRFEKMQGDCSRLAILRGHFDFSAPGFADLERTIEDHAIKFALFDPLFSFTGRADINKTSDVRPITDRLNKIAAKFGIAIVGIRHINKSKGFGDARNAGAHSVAWLQGCRSGLIVGHDTEDKAKRGIAQHKLNIAAESNTVYGFEIDAEGVFGWTGESDLSIAGMLAHKSNESNEDRSAVADAVRFLKEQLANGGKLKRDLDIEARGEGINLANLNRAKARLAIKPSKIGMAGGWFWELPATS